MRLRWTAPKGRKPAKYLVLRDGKVVGHTTHHAFTDHRVKAGRTYRYTIVAVDRHGHRGKPTRVLRVRVPTRPAPGPAAPFPSPVAAVTPAPAPPTPSPEPPMTTAMVDRLFWRAGFGPTQAQRDAWTGRPASALVDWMLDTPPAGDPAFPSPLAADGSANDPLATTDELIMDWLDLMQRAVNPLPERLAFFWHRHWAVSIADGSISGAVILAYRDRLRRYANLAASPGLSFRDLAWEMTTQDAAMSLYLNGNQNIKRAPNENYAREFMELFCLGPNGPDGNPNYAQADVSELARAFTGWRLDTTTGLISFPENNGNFDAGQKVVLGRTIPAVAGTKAADRIPTVRLAVDIVLEHANHPQFLIRKLWAEFIANPIPQATLDDLIARYTAGGYALRPVLRGILTHPLIFESLGEPNLVKPPVVYLVGLLRQLGAPMKAPHPTRTLVNMQQVPYQPPNVAGWEGGMSWFNTNTVQGRFDAVVRAQYLKYSTYYKTPNPLPVIPAEDYTLAFARAYADAGRPWISDNTRAAVLEYARTARVDSPARLRQRYYTLQALILGGPDGQVM